MNETNVSTSQLEQKKCILISENKELKKENDTLKSQKEDLYEKNRENVDTRARAMNDKSRATTILIVVAIVGFIFFISLIGKGILQSIIAVLAILVAIVVDYLQFKKIQKAKPECENLNHKLSKYDAQVKELDTKLNENNSKISKNNEAISLIDIEIKADAIQNAGCICVYTSQHFYKGSIPSKPLKDKEMMCTEGIVSIDGMQVGVVSAPFAIFKVKPGTHVVTVQVPFFKAADDFSEAIKYGGGTKIYNPQKTFTTNPTQITIKNGQSVVLFVQMAYRLRSTGEEYLNYENVPFIEKYTSVAEFLKDTNQSNLMFPEIPILPE